MRQEQPLSNRNIITLRYVEGVNKGDHGLFKNNKKWKKEKNTVLRKYK